MSEFVYTLNGVEIPSIDVTKLPQSDVRISFGDSVVIASTLDIILDNNAGDYDDRSSTGMFYSTDWYNWSFEIYDSEKNIYIWKGKLKNISINDNDCTVTLNTTNLIKDLTTTNVEYSASGISPAEAIYEILTDNAICNISDDNLSLSGFEKAQVIQEAAPCLINIGFTLQDNKQALDIIIELCKIGVCSFYMVDDKVCLKQYTDWDSQLGDRVDSKYILPQSYSHQYKDDKIYNYYSIAYLDTTVKYTTGSNTASQALYGKITWNTPPTKVTSNGDTISTDPADYRILITSKAGADWSGNLIVSRWGWAKRVAKLKTDNRLAYLRLMDQVDLDFGDYYREPCAITAINYNRESEVVDLELEFLNLPHEVVSRDVTPPDAVYIAAVFPIGDSSICVKWSKSFETDHIGYTLFYTSTRGEWESEVSISGVSPLDVKNPSMTQDGYVYTYVYGLNDGVEYHFKITSYDNRFNNSVDSNIVSCYASASTILNQYKVDGSILSSVSLSEHNIHSGFAPSLSYYISPLPQTLPFRLGYCATWESGEIYKDGGWTGIILMGAGKVYFEYRSYNNSTWSSWSDRQLIDAHTVVNFAGEERIQWRVGFGSTNYSDTDFFSVIDLQ